jgi:DNA-binding XRE family transcriptional regulator
MSESEQTRWLVQMRAELGLTQEDVAQALGVTPRTVLNWEQGHNKPKLSIRQVKALCALFGVQLSELPNNFPFEDSPAS